MSILKGLGVLLLLCTLCSCCQQPAILLFDGEIIIDRVSGENDKYAARCSLRKRTGSPGSSSRDETQRIIPLELTDNVCHEYRSHITDKNLYRTIFTHEGEKLTLIHGDGLLWRIKVRPLDSERLHLTGFLIETEADGPRLYPIEMECRLGEWTQFISIRRSRRN